MLLKSNSVSFESATNDGLLKGNIGVKSAPFRLASYCVCSKLTTRWVVCQNSLVHIITFMDVAFFMAKFWELILKANILVLKTKSL